MVEYYQIKCIMREYNVAFPHKKPMLLEDCELSNNTYLVKLIVDEKTQYSAEITYWRKEEKLSQKTINILINEGCGSIIKMICAERFNINQPIPIRTSNSNIINTTMETNSKIAIKKAIENHPLIAAQLKAREPKEDVIDNFAQLCKLEAVFIKFNLNIIRNWI